MQKLKAEQARGLLARAERKNSKREARLNTRGTKRRDMIISHQEKVAHAVARLRQAVSEKRIQFDQQTVHLQKIHEKQRVNLLASQDRYYRNEKLLVELETSRMKV
jgi:hypothetical protein